MGRYNIYVDVMLNTNDSVETAEKAVAKLQETVSAQRGFFASPAL